MYDEIPYKGYWIVLNFYNRGEYTVQYNDGDIWFRSEAEAREFIDEVTR